MKINGCIFASRKKEQPNKREDYDTVQIEENES